MTRKKAEKIARGITDKIECNTVDIDEWAEFWGFTREEYEVFLETAIKALEKKPKTGHWVKYGIPRCGEQHYKCTSCGYYINFGQWGEFYTKEFKYCPNCGVKMKGGAE